MDGSRDNLFVEGPEILLRSTASANDQNVDRPIYTWSTGSTRAKAIEERDRFSNLTGRTLALNPRRGNDDVQTSVSPLEDLQNIANGRPGWRGDDSNPPWE